MEKNVNIKKHKNVFITVPFKKINAVKLSGAGDIRTKNTIKAANLSVLLSGSGDIDLSVDAEKIDSKVTGSGDISLKGETDYLNVAVLGSGDFSGFELEAEDVDAKVTGSGDIEVYVTKAFLGNVIGSGDIAYKGNPKTENTKIVGSGDIDKQ